MSFISFSLLVVLRTNAGPVHSSSSEGVQVTNQDLRSDVMSSTVGHVSSEQGHKTQMLSISKRAEPNSSDDSKKNTTPSPTSGTPPATSSSKTPSTTTPSDFKIGSSTPVGLSPASPLAVTNSKASSSTPNPSTNLSSKPSNTQSTSDNSDVKAAKKAVETQADTTKVEFRKFLDEDEKLKKSIGTLADAKTNPQTSDVESAKKATDNQAATTKAEYRKYLDEQEKLSKSISALTETKIRANAGQKKDNTNSNNLSGLPSTSKNSSSTHF